MSTRRRHTFQRWLIGAVLIAALASVVAHRAEEREFVHLLEQAQPFWLVLALGLQGLTYVAEGQIWRTTVNARAPVLGLGRTVELGFAKLFVDQTVPTAGLSGTLVLARALESLGIARATVRAAVLVATESYFATYAIALLVTVVYASRHQALQGPLIAVAAVMIMAGTVIAGTIHRLGCAAGGSQIRPWPGAALIRRLRDLAGTADSSLARHPRLLLGACFWQGLIFALDAATFAVLLRSLGVALPLASVAAAYMLASLLRSVGILPGGLGSFDAAVTFTLHGAGAPISGALAAALLFRGLAFWLPLVPGASALRRVRARAASPRRAPWSTGE